MTCRVIGIAYRKPKQEQLDQAEPIKDEETGIWSCPFCRMDGFAQLNDVSNTLVYTVDKRFLGHSSANNWRFLMETLDD